MNTWLDELTFAMGSGVRKELSPLKVDVVQAMTIFAVGLLDELAGPGLPREIAIQCRFVADCIAFYRPEFAETRSAFQVSRAFGRSMVGPISDADRASFERHLDERRFTYIDCPPGAFVVGGDVEIQAIFVKTAVVVDRSRGAPVPSGARVDAIVGLHGVSAMQWLGWTLGEPGTLVAQAPREETLFPPSPPPLALLGAAGRRTEEVRASVERAIVTVVAHARRHEGSAMVRPLPRLPMDDVARRKRTPHGTRTLFDVKLLSMPDEDAHGTGAGR